MGRCAAVWPRTVVGVETLALGAMDTPWRTVGLGLSALACLSGCARAGGEPAQFSVNSGLGLDAGQTITQTVNPAGDVIKAIDVQVLAIPSPGDGVVHLDIGEGNRQLSHISVPIGDIHEGWVSFVPEQPLIIPDVINLAFSVTGEGTLLLAANSTPTDADPKVEPAHDPYPQGEGRHNNKPITGDLVFRVQGPASTTALTHQLSAMMKEGAKRLLNQPTFTAFWAAGLAIAFGLMGLGFARRRV